jgi:AcrR family transcriptional regulator
MWSDVPFVNEGSRGVMPPSEDLGPRRDERSAGQEAGTRRVRADARRNEEAVLEAAKVVFARLGVDAPVRDIALQAGVGVGTLYRRFPKRADLVAAVFRHEVDACAAAAGELAAELPPMDALREWLLRYTRFLAAKRGLASALHSGDPAFEALPSYFRSRFEPALEMLLDAASRAGEIGAGGTAHDLLRAIGNLSVATGDDGEAHVESMIGLLMDGLRYRAGKPAPLP